MFYKYIYTYIWGMENEEYNVYGLIDPRDNKIKYVGMSSDVDKRYYQHCKSCYRDNVKSVWIKHLKSIELLPRLMIIESCLSKDEAKICEKYFIKYYSKLNMIFNHSHNELFEGMQPVKNGKLLEGNPLYKQLIKSIEL